MYLSWLVGMLRLDLGTSLISGAPVLHELAAPLRNTLILTFGSFCITVGLALLIGIPSATTRYPLLSRIATQVAYFISAAPNQ